MSDQCENCICRGNLIYCEKISCGYRENWYAKEQQKKINKLEAIILQLEKENNE